jgi:hypothetical protein
METNKSPSVANVPQVLIEAAPSHCQHEPECSHRKAHRSTCNCLLSDDYLADTDNPGIIRDHSKEVCPRDEPLAFH